MNFATDRQDEELMNELRTRIARINRYIQHPDRDTLVALLGEDLQGCYGSDRVLRMTDGILWGGNDIDEDLSKTFTDLFETFNKRYFGGNLPDYCVTVRLSISYYGRTIWRECRGIELLAGSEARMVIRLLEEMAHLATSEECGAPWRDELLRLSKADAPIDEYPGTENLSAEDFITKVASISAEMRLQH